MDSKPDGVKSCAKSREWNSRPGDVALGRSTLVQGFVTLTVQGSLDLKDLQSLSYLDLQHLY